MAQAQAHEQESSIQAAAGDPALCVTGCGFFGSATTKNMCSKCYLGHLKSTEVPPAPAAEGKIKADKAILAFKTLAIGHDSAAAAASEIPAADVPAKKAAPTRCMTCKKKVGLLGFSCRCGGTFCSLHRYVDGHACGFD